MKVKLETHRRILLFLVDLLNAQRHNNEIIKVPNGYSQGILGLFRDGGNTSLQAPTSMFLKER